LRGRRRSLSPPPDPWESLSDVEAMRRGESRWVSCWLRQPRGSRKGRYRQGGLELSAAAACWRPWPDFGIRKARALDITGVAEVRPAGRSDGSLTSPVNLHLFTLVRCATPTGYLDLFVPTADVPLVTWCLGGHDDALLEVPARAGKRQPMSRRERRRRALAGLGITALGVPFAVTGHPMLAMPPMNLGLLLFWSAVLSPRAPRGRGKPAADD
jgi:hypothetical protein